MGDRYDPSRDVTPDFLRRAAEWIERTGEVLVILRYLRAAGAKDYALCRSREALEEIVNQVSVGTDIEVLRDRQLPLRGIVTKEFTRRALTEPTQGIEYLALSIETRPGTRFSERALLSDSPEDLREFLDEMAGQEVAIGVCPDFNAADYEGLISASKGGIDGPR